MADINPEQQENLNRFIESINSAAQEMDPLTKAEKDLEAQLKKSREELSKFTKGLGDSAKNYAKALSSTNEGVGKYGDAAKGAANAAGDLIGNFGFLGKAIGGVIKLFGGMAAAALKQQDSLVGAYQSMSDFGAIDASGLKGVLENLNSIGLVSEQYQQLNGILKKVSPELVGLGGSVAVGKQKLIDALGAITKDRGLQGDLARFGYTTETMNEQAAIYIAQQAKYGLSQNKTTQQLKTETGAYLKNLSELSALTGLSRDELQSKRDQQMAELRWGDYIRDMELNQSKAQADRMSNFMIEAESRYGKEAASSMRELIVNQAPMTQAGAAMLMAVPGLLEISDKLKKGTMDLSTGINTISKSVLENRKPFIQLTGMIMDGTRDLAEIPEFVNGALQSTTLSQADVRKNLEKIKNDDKSDVAADAKRRRQEQDLRILQDKLLREVGSSVISVFEKLSSVAWNLGKVFARLVDKFGHVVGLGDMNMSALFIDDLGDANEALATEQQKLVDIVKKRAEKEQALTRAITRQAELEQEQINDPQNFAEGGSALTLSLVAKEVDALTQSLKDDKTRVKAIEGNIKSLKEIKKSKEEENKLKKEEEERKLIEHRRTGTVADSRRTDLEDNSQTTLSTDDQVKKSASDAGSGQAEQHQLKVRPTGDVTRGGELSDNTLAAAKLIQSLPGFKHFTSLNDDFHKDKSSLHASGRGIDFTLENEPTPEEAKQFKQMLKSKLAEFGVKEVLNEYHGPEQGGDRNKNTTGGHFHAGFGARYGGVFQGPSSGYMVQLHGREIVKPLPGTGGLGEHNVSKTELSGLNNNNSNNNNMPEMLTGLYDRLDVMIEYLRNSTGTQEELLQATRN